ncbi:MAG: methionine--tRNA ligase [Bacillota bacterium]|jgi:methionyl-tRNA synthetase
MTEKQKFYITTPIYYPSDNLHIGHAYTTVAADAMTRFKKLQGYDAYFLTGTDEHGQKIQRKAAEAGKTPQQFVDEIVAGVKDLWKLMNIEYDDFIRTTDQRHEEVVQKLFQKVYDQGDIYKSEYSGWYCTPCETFFTERQLGEGHTCPDCGRPVEMTKEESYFFKMSKYADRWLQFIEDHPDFIQPESRKNEMINFVKQGLDDLCVSRTTFDWGIKVPFDQKHVVYVWFDALINYISALGYGTDHDELYKKYWPADVHLMAKDIIRFHSIIWPIMLMALDIPIPEKVVAHGWLLMSDGKMSKSKGNVVDPKILAERYGVDAIRFFLLREMAYGMDAVYSEEALVNRINIDLANDYGNLISRTTSMIQKFIGGEISAPSEATEFDADLIALAEATPANMAKFMDKVDAANAIGEVWKLVSKANKYIDDCAPWALNKAGETAKLQTVLYNLAEVIRFITILISPVMPNTPEKVWEQMGLIGHENVKTWDSLKWGGFPAGIKVNRGEPIFPRIDLAEMEKQWAAEAEAKAKAEAAKSFEPIKPEITIDDFAKIDFRVCKVLSCEKVKKADKLLKMEIQVGSENRTVVSGIAQRYTPEEMVGKQLVLVANLKPAKLRGIESQGMILAASHNGEMEVLEVPANILPGGQVK